MMQETHTIKIERLVYGGDALGRLPDGRAVFVPFAIPGELVQARLVEDKAKFVRAELLEVLEGSPARVIPRCPHFGFCGGCHYQHMNNARQLEAKVAILKEQLERIGGFRELPEIECRPSPEPWNYRNTVQFHLTRQGKLGYLRARSNQPFAIRECHLPEAAINDLWPKIEIEPTAGVDRVDIRLGRDDDLMVVLESKEAQVVDFGIEGLAVSVVQQGPSGDIVLAGSDHTVVENYGRQFIVSAGSFFQVNSRQAEEMVRCLLDQLTLSSEQTLVDAYCGVGLFSAFLAAKVKRLVGIEISPQACEDFTTNLDELDNVELYEAAVEDVLNSVSFHPDIMVMDPPRAGLGSRAVEGILFQDARQLEYISCDPATLARDAKQLATGGYSLKKVTLFDMFPQTYHIESLSVWEKI